MLNLLNESLFEIRTEDGTDQVSLPVLLRALTLSGDVVLMTQGHQDPWWHQVMSQLGALCLHALGTEDLRDVTPADWRHALLLLSAGDERPWHLIPEDDGPAFLQPPVSDGSKASRRLSAAEIDLPDTAKNFDVKPNPHMHVPDLWIYALAAGQTAGNYRGRGHYGSVRMNSGKGHRTFACAGPSHSAAALWRRDVVALLHHRRTLLTGPWGYSSNGLGLTWLREGPFQLADLDPLFIEASRCVRLFGNATDVDHALVHAALAPRIDAAHWRGHLGDFWTPLVLDDAGLKAPNLNAAFRGDVPPILIWSKLFAGYGDFTPSPSVAAATDGDILRAGALVTGGLSERQGWRDCTLSMPLPDEDLLQSRGLEVFQASKALRNALRSFPDDSVAPTVAEFLRLATEDFYDRIDDTTCWIAELWRIADDVFHRNPAVRQAGFQAEAARLTLRGSLYNNIGSPPCPTCGKWMSHKEGHKRWQCTPCGKGSRKRPRRPVDVRCPRCGKSDVVEGSLLPSGSRRLRCLVCRRQAVSGWKDN